MSSINLNLQMIFGAIRIIYGLKEKTPYKQQTIQHIFKRMIKYKCRYQPKRSFCVQVLRRVHRNLLRGKLSFVGHVKRFTPKSGVSSQGNLYLLIGNGSALSMFESIRGYPHSSYFSDIVNFLVLCRASLLYRITEARFVGKVGRYSSARILM